MAQYDVPLPEAGVHVWYWFHELSSTRQNGMGINPITHAEIMAWAWLTGIKPLPWEVKAIKDIDSAFIASVLADQEKPKKKA